MQTFGAIAVYQKGEDVDGSAFFKDNIVIRLGVSPCPEVAWSGDPRMITYSEQQNATLKALGLFSDEVHRNANGSAGHVELVVKFPDLATANDVFERAVLDGIADIYLYKHGTLWRKYD